ncbi:MAG TPA: hypothetical protein PLA50_02175, partial [Bacteroidia bacterium]|nr:hypothetical protein [Bacteroidia bacterium]
YSHADPYRHSQIGYNPRDANTTTTHYDATGRIRVKAVNDVQLVSNKFEVGTEGGYWPDPGIRTGNAAFAQIGHGGDRGSVIDMNFSGAVIVEAGRDVTLKGGKAYNDYAQIGHGGYVNRDTDFARVTSISGGAITVTATTGNVTLLGGTGFHASAHIGHGGTNIILSDFVESAINVTAGGNVTVQGGAGTAASNVDSSSAHAQIGHGGYNADFVDSAGVSQVPGSGYGYKGEITVDAGGAVFVTAGNYDASSYAVIGHGGGLSDGDHSGNVTVTAKTGIALKGGAGAVALFAQIGHVLYNSTNALSGSITATTDSGNVLLQGGGSSTTYTMIGHGGQNSVGATSRIGASPITVTATTGDVLLLSGKAGYAGAKIGHGGHLVLLSSFDESSVSVTAGRHIRLVSPQFDTYTNVSYASTQIGHGGVASTVKAADGTVLGYKGTIDVTAGGKIDLIAGRNAGTYNWSLIGHTSFNSSNAQGVHDGNITVKAGTVDGLDAYGVTVQAASGDYNGVVNTSTSYYSFASIGHRGHSGGTILSGDILVDVLQGGVTLQGGNGLEGSTAGTTPADLRLHGASIGHGGFNVISGMSGDIRVHAEGDILLRAGTGPGSPVVIGHGGRDARGPISGLIEVISRNGSLELDSTLSYSTAANIYSITSEDRGTVYIGHGGALAGGSGTRQGDILVDVAGEISLVGDFSFIGHRTTGTVSNSDLTIRARSFDRATGDSGSQLFSLDAGLGAMLATSLGWGHLSLVGMGSQGIEMAGAMSWNSSYDFNLLSYSDIHIASLIANQGSGDVTVVAGWDPAKAVLHTASDFPPPGPSAPAAPWRYYMIRDVNAATDLIGVADSYGNGDAVVTVGSSTAAAAVGTANGTTTVLGHSVEVLGSTTNANAYALIGTQPAAGLARAGAITVMANGGGVAVRGGGLDNTYAGIGHRSLGGTTSPINSAIRVESLAGLSLRGGAGLLSSAQIGHGGASGAVGVVGGAINLKATTDIELIGGGGAQAYAQIGHGGSGTSGTLSGDVTIDQVRNVTLAGGGSHAYAQIGHGGASGVDPTLSLGDPSFAKRALSASGTVQVVNTTGAVSMTGGAGTHSAYVQIGHGGVALSNGGAIGGDVTVEA